MASKKIKNKGEITMDDGLLNSLSKYYPSISVNQYNWVGNAFEEFTRAKDSLL